ncbi:Agglutinin, partial [Cetobacterium somerae ATCC BAA-474]
ATLKRYAASNNVVVKNLIPTDTSQFVIGTVKLNDQNTEMTETSINSGLRFFGGNSRNIVGFTQVIFAWDNVNNKTIVLQTTIPQVTVNDSYNKNARNYSLNVSKVYNGYYTISSPSYPTTTTTMVPGEVYTNDSAPLFRLGVASTSSNAKYFYDNFTFGDITINTVGGTINNSSFTITNPIAKGNTSGIGTYVLDGTTRSPSGLPRNINTLTWTSAGINSNPGYTLYPSIHNIGVWFTDGTTTV